MNPLGRKRQLQVVQGGVVVCLQGRCVHDRCRGPIVAGDTTGGDKAVILARHMAGDAGALAGVAEELVLAEVRVQTVVIACLVVQSAGSRLVVGVDEYADTGGIRVGLDALARFAPTVAAGTEGGGPGNVIDHCGAIPHVDVELLSRNAQGAGTGVGVAGGAI